MSRPSDEAMIDREEKRVRSGYTFSDLLKSESHFVAARRVVAGFRDPTAAADQDAEALESPAAETEPGPTVGMALSGGGIRSASVSLGFIQVLRKYGLFRYVDYLSSISGGSYTGALLASSYYRASGETAGQQNNGSSKLDIDLIDQTIQPPRVRALMNDGRYLMRPLEWANRFFSGWLSLLLVIGSGLLAMSALIAFLWRSMDFYSVRYYLAELGLGGDMWAAVLPVFVLSLAWLVFWGISFFREGASARGRWASRILVALILCTLATVAGLIGNGDISFVSGENRSASFLKVPLIASIFGGLIPTFFRKQLFRSGLVESSLLEKLIYRYTAFAVVLGIPMLLIGYFARENVSGFSTSRDGRLLQGDVKDFPAFAEWYQADVESKLAQGESIPKSDGLLKSIRELRLEYKFEHDRIAGADRWPSPPPKRPDNVADATDVAPYLPAIRDPETLDEWAAWKYAPALKRVGAFAGHVFDFDNDDPFEKAVEKQRLLFEEESKLLTVFNESFLTRADFAKQLLPQLETVAGQIDWQKAPWSAFPENVRQQIEANPPVIAASTIPWDKSPWKDYPTNVQNHIIALETAGPLQHTPEDWLETNRTLLEALHPELVRSRSDIRRMNVIHPDQLHRFVMFLVFASVFVVSAYVINPNTSSIQRYYQERLAAAYLGGSDEAHNMRLTDLAPRVGAGPLLLIGGAANYRFRPANKDRQPDWLSPDQPIESTDRIGHFEFSPLYCGSADLGYARTDSYCNGSLRLADAVAISGAAVNPLYFSRWEMLIIFGLLNLRLGQWMPNPRRGNVSLQPTFAALMHDIFNFRQRRTTPVTERRHILLTDGGHFDNTGLQALFDRRCKMIVACDASQDTDFAFDSLAAVIGRMKGQAGITLREIGSNKELDLGRHSAEFKNKSTHCFCCEIHYGKRPGDENENNKNVDKEDEVGLLVYFKTSLTGDEPPFVWHHAAVNATFPHDSSINQSFSPEQFCAYLGLGQHFVEGLVNGQRNAVEDVGKSREFKLREFTALFLSPVEPTARNHLLNRLFPGTESADFQRDFSDYEKAAARFSESIRLQQWQKLPVATEQLRKCLAAKSKLPAPCLVLDRLADEIVKLDDFSHPNAERALEEAATLFWKALVSEFGSDDKSRNCREMACEIRSRFQRPGQFRSVRSVIRQAADGDLDFLVEHLTNEGDVAHDGFVVEVLGALGERFASSSAKRSGRLRKLVQSKRFSSSEDIRDSAERLLAALGETDGDDKKTAKAQT